MHLDQLADENPRARVSLIVIPVDIGHSGTHEVIHELKLTSYRGTELFKRSGFSTALPDASGQNKTGAIRGDCAG